MAGSHKGTEENGMELNANHTSRATMLQRLPAILAVTASSYGLELRAPGAHRPQAAGTHRRDERHRTERKPHAQG